MKIIGNVVLGLLALALGLVAVVRLGAPALALLAAAAVLGAWLWRGLKKDAYVGWGNLRAIAVMASLGTGAWLLMSVLAGSLLLAAPLALAFGLSIWSIRYCSARINTAFAPGADTGPSIGSAHLNTEQANALVDHTFTENRRRHSRGQSLHLQAENLDLVRKNRELEQEVARLKAEVQRLDGALHDPFYDPA